MLKEGNFRQIAQQEIGEETAKLKTKPNQKQIEKSIEERTEKLIEAHFAERKTGDQLLLFTMENVAQWMQSGLQAVTEAAVGKLDFGESELEVQLCKLISCEDCKPGDLELVSQFEFETQDQKADQLYLDFARKILSLCYFQKSPEAMAGEGERAGRQQLNVAACAGFCREFVVEVSEAPSRFYQRRQSEQKMELKGS